MKTLAQQIIQESGYDFDYPISESQIEGLLNIAIAKLSNREEGMDPSPVSSQPVKGEEAAAIDVLKRYTNIDHEGNVSTHSSVILGAMEKFKALTPLLPNEKGEEIEYEEIYKTWYNTAFRKMTFPDWFKAQGFKITKEKI